MSFKPITCDAEYAKDANIKREDILELKNWLREVPLMPDVPEIMLIQFYHASNYKVERTKNLVELCYTFKSTAMELFTHKDYDPSRYSWNCWDINYALTLPKTTPEGYRIFYIGLKDFSSSKYDFQIGISSSSQVMISTLLEKGTCPGYAFVFDVRGFGIGHLLAMHVSILRKFLYFIQEAVPFKVKAIHVIHVHSMFDKMMMLAKPFLKKELYDMIQIHSDMENFYKAVTPEIVPTDLGGTFPLTRDEIMAETIERIAALKDEIEEESQRRKEEEKCQRSFFGGWKLF